MFIDIRLGQTGFCLFALSNDKMSACPLGYFWWLNMIVALPRALPVDCHENWITFSWSRGEKHFKMTEPGTILATILLYPSHYLQFSVQFSLTYNVWTKDFQITAAPPMVTVAKFLVNNSSIYPSPLLYAPVRNEGSWFFRNRSGLLWKAQSSRPYLLSFCAIRVRTKTTAATTALLTASEALSC